MAAPSTNFFDAAARALHLDLSFETSINLLWVLASAIIAILAGQFIIRFFHKRYEARKAIPRRPSGPPAPGELQPLTLRHRLLLRCLPLSIPLLYSLLGGIGVFTLRKTGYDPAFMIALRPLFICWVIITMIYVITHSRAKTIFVALLILPVSMPFMVPYVEEFGAMLEDISLKIGKSEINALMVLKLIIIGTLMFWTASAIKEGTVAWLSRMQHIRWSTRQLLQNVLGIAIYALAIILVLSMLGIDLTAFAVLGGALGVGIGLGLQKIASNFISGLILLSEQTIQVNDMIEIAGSNVSGLVRHTGARYTLIETIDNREIMIPNDDLITNRVINWTYSDSQGVLSFDIGVGYDSDLEVVRDILIDVVSSHPLVLKDPAPSCLLKEFAASSVNFGIVVHLQDVRERRMGIKSELLFAIWKRFKDKNIDIPYPQMTLHYTPPQLPPEQKPDNRA